MQSASLLFLFIISKTEDGRITSGMNNKDGSHGISRCSTECSCRTWHNRRVVPPHEAYLACSRTAGYTGSCTMIECYQIMP